jgi:Na+/serine symporter
MISFASLDPQMAVYMIVALVLNLLIILWAVARLSHDLRLLKLRNSMLEDSINLLDQSISNLTVEFQTIRQIENRKAGSPDKVSAPHTAKGP